MADEVAIPALLAGNGCSDVHLLVVCTAERGLCGGFNANIFRKALQVIGECEATGAQVSVAVVDPLPPTRKGRPWVRRMVPGETYEVVT